MSSALRILANFGVLVMTVAMSGCVPTISMHSYRNVAVTITRADSGEPVASLPFRVIYDYNPVDSPIAYHLELRTPHEVKAETDKYGKAVVNLADYAWGICVELDAQGLGYPGRFWLNKELIRKGGTVEQERYPYPDLPKLRLDLKPVVRPNYTRQPTPGVPLTAYRASRTRRGCANR